MRLKRGETLELEITDVAFGGKGISKPDGFTIFVDNAVTYDKVLARITKKKKSYAQARILEIISPSPYRMEARCRYSGYCGGCKWQFLDYDVQLQYKKQHVKDSLEHIALAAQVPVLPVLASQQVFGYRNKMEFSCSDRRWLLPDELGNENIPIDFALGLHVPGTFHKVLDISECLLQPEAGNLILEDVRQYMKASGLPVYGLKTHKGFWRFLMLRHSAAFDRWLVNIITSSENKNALMPLSGILMEKYPRIVSIVNNITARKAGIAVGEYEINIAGESFLLDKIGKFEFEISANSFFQTNTKGAERLYETIKKFADLKGGEKIMDLYCGTGAIAIFLSDMAKEVIGMEITKSAVKDARKNCSRNGVKNCRFISGDIKELLADAEKAPDVIIIDPPRAGMHKKVVAKIMELSPCKIIYVSCNPATMARDFLMMKDYYDMDVVQPVDMFPHTYHIESVARLIKKRRG